MAHTTITHPTRTRGISAIFAKAWQTWVERRRKRKQMRVLAELNDHLLRDIGFVRECGSRGKLPISLMSPFHFGG